MYGSIATPPEPAGPENGTRCAYAHVPENDYHEYGLEDEYGNDNENDMEVSKRHGSGNHKFYSDGGRYAPGGYGDRGSSNR
jgi:hypothetical protein